MLHANDIKDYNVKKTYMQIIVLAMIAHFSYVVIFLALHLYTLAIYNVCSDLFYIMMLLLIKKGCLRFVVTSIHIEVCIFAIVSTIYGGWELGTALYLIAMTSLTYVCPFKHSSIPYLLAGVDIVVFLLLRLYSSFMMEDFCAVSEVICFWLYMYNVCSCFAVILYAAFTSKVSAIVSQKKLEDENRNLTHRANYDELTGLLTRRGLLEQLHEHHGQKVVVLGDIDDFKKVNDTWGHECGDMVLSEVANIMKRNSHGHKDVEICRWGGEEFILLFCDEDIKECSSCVKKLCQIIEEHHFYYQNMDIQITMTFGISSSAQSLSIEQLIAIADQRMYQGKHDGKNCVVVLEDNEA